MPNVNELLKRIDAEFAGSQQKMKDFQTQQVEQHEQREQRLARFGALLDELSDVWRPRLEALRERFGDQVKTAPTITPTQRSVTFSFATELARVNMRLSASPDADARHAIFSYDLDIMPILMKFDSHSEIEFPLEAVDRNALAAWFDDQIVGFVAHLSFLARKPVLSKGPHGRRPDRENSVSEVCGGRDLRAQRKDNLFCRRKDPRCICAASGGKEEVSDVSASDMNVPRRARPWPARIEPCC